MSAARSSTQFANGVRGFIQFAATNSGYSQKIVCPCKLCCNISRQSLEDVEDHIISVGFMPRYTTWVYHGESVYYAIPTI